MSLTDLVVKTIEDYRKERGSNQQEALFLNKLGGPIDRHGIHHRLERLGKIAGVKVNSHALRRNFVTINANKGRPLQMLQIACGHSLINYYNPFILSDQRKRGY